MAPATLPEKIGGRHRDRLAVVYVRQSTLQQVGRHPESTRLQYALAERAQQLGWPPERVVVIDDDLGRSGASAAVRPGFQRLVAEVGLGRVGLVLGVEVSRLARSCRDWHQLLEICALFDTLIADSDGVLDPAAYNDRLLLGLKGTMSEAELHILKGRMDAGRQAKAGRGELFFNLPRGYVRRPSGEIALDPDEQVQAVIRLVFVLFDQRRTVNGVLVHLAAHDIRLPYRLRGGPAKGELVWRHPNRYTLKVVFTQMTKADVLALGAGGQHVADLDVGVGDDHPVDQQQHELAALLEAGAGQPALHPGPESLEGSRHAGELLPAGRVLAQLLLLLGQCPHALLQIASPPSVLVERDDRSEVGVREPLQLVPQVRLAAA
jgi:DNA invertase Pin-like site-specific DNA recombinase